MASDNKVEYLHQQASALYLQGEYDAALEAWRQLLSLDPHDERAREGARLCELLVKEAGGSVTATRPSAGAPPPPPAVGFGVGEELDQELSEIDELLGGRKGRDWMDSPPAKPAAAPPANTGTIEFDLTAVPAAGAPSTAAEFHFEVDAPDKPPRDPSEAFDLNGEDSAAKALEQAGDTAAEELQRRSNELMAEALEYYERGEREEALSALSRLTILDEHNEAALNFAAHIRSELDPASRPSAAAEPAATAAEPDLGDFAPARGAGGTHEPLDLGLPSPQKVEPVRSAAVTAAPSTTISDEPMGDPDFAEELSVATVTGNTARSSRGTGRARPNKALILAASGLVLVGVLYVVYSATSGSSPAENAVEDPPAGTVAPPAADVPAAETPAEEPAAATGPLSPEARAKIDELMNRADGDFESANFAAAVLSYNEALKLDPQNEVARKKLNEAGELFREQKAKLEERAAAFKSFEEGDYRNALRLFYRFEPKDAAEAQRLSRYKAIGWYNLGVRALMAGDCRLARSHLLESQQIDALDPYLARALEMNAACFEGASGAYYEAVRTLPLRGLEN